MNTLLYSKPLLCANTVRNTAHKAKTKLCKITEIHMMSSVGRSANPEEIPTMQMAVKPCGSGGVGWVVGIIAVALHRKPLVCTTF